MFVQPGRSISWRLHQLAVQFTVCSCQMLRQFSKAKTMQLFQSTKCIHQVMQPVATTSGGAPAILGDANMHSRNNQSINQSYILLCKRSGLGWWALIFCWWSQVLDFCSWLEIALLVQCSLDPTNKGTYYNPCHQSLDITVMGVSIIRCSMENTENWLVFNPTTQRQKVWLILKECLCLCLQYLPILEALIV
jgi:hypothetical protein